MVNAEALRTQIEQFVQSAAAPVLIQSGNPPLAFTTGTYLLEVERNRVILTAWDGERTVVLRLRRALGESRGRLQLEVERLARRGEAVELVDAARPQARPALERCERRHLAELLRTFLHRQFPEYAIAELSADPDLEHSLSPVYARALAVRGREGLAAMAAPRDKPAADGLLTFALIWLDYLRRRERQVKVHTLVLLAPIGEEKQSACRLIFLDDRIQVILFAFDEEGRALLVDPKDHGNLDCSLPACPALEDLTGNRERELILRLESVEGFEAVPQTSGRVSLRIRGLEFAYFHSGRLWVGLETKRQSAPSNFAELLALAQQIAGVRHAGAPNRDHPLWRRAPERWLEYQVRRNIQQLDATLRPTPIYSEVPARAGLDRGAIDLLAIDSWGRLALLELKTEEEIHLPMQALDYWIRTKWHLERGDFAGGRYFAEMNVRTVAPRLLLIGPCLEFHPANDIVMSYFSPQVEAERIGVAMHWRDRLEAAYRQPGPTRAPGGSS